MSHRRQLSWASALRDLNQDRATRPEVREERLRTTAGLRGSPALALSAWRGRNAKRYVVGVFSTSAVAADDLAGPNLVIAARRDAHGIASLVGVTCDATEASASAWIASVKRAGATEIHVCRTLYAQAARTEAVVALSPFALVEAA